MAKKKETPVYSANPGLSANEEKIAALLRQIAELARETAQESTSSPHLIYGALMDQFPALAAEKREHFIVCGMDGRRRPLYWQVVSIGTLNATLVHPREVFREAIRQGAASVVVFHNHPSGDTSPSAEDLLLTERLLQAGQILGIQVDDHLIVSQFGYVSLRTERRGGFR